MTRQKRIAERMLVSAEERGLVGAGWRAARWWTDDEWLVAALDCVTGPGGVAVRFEADGGVVWIGLDAVDGGVRYFSVCGAEQVDGRSTLDGPTWYRLRKAAPSRWAYWVDAARDEAKSVKRRVAARDYVGGLLASGDAVLARVVAADDAGKPLVLSDGTREYAAPAGGRWWVWSDNRVDAARSLLLEGKTRYSGYMPMRGAVAIRARKLLRAEARDLAEITKP